MTTGAGRKEPSGSLPRAYRFCLKAYRPGIGGPSVTT